MEPFFVSFGMLALSEMGDKTQLLTLCLASQYRKPVAVGLGIFAATLVGNIIAALMGEWVGRFLSPGILHILLGFGFIAASVWAFLPEKEETCKAPLPSHGVFLATAITFLIAETGDKTQLVTATLAAQYNTFWLVVLGTSMGMMAANIPVIVFSQKIMRKIPLRLIKILSGVAFIGMGTI